MDGKAKYIFPIIMSGVMAFLMTGLVTMLNLGLPANFLALWLRAFAIAWPFAALSAFLAIPIARRLTGHIVARIEGRS
jgi:Protein of unknown function (DUF2798)